MSNFLFDPEQKSVTKHVRLLLQTINFQIYKTCQTSKGTALWKMMSDFEEK